MITAIVCLALLPLALLLDLLSLGRKMAAFSQRRRAVPLQQRNIARAASGAFVLVICAVVAFNGFFPVVICAAVAALALVYVVVGIHGSQGSRFDVMSAFWRAALVLGCAAVLVLIFIRGVSL